ncbi:LLM class flavin-dependent oxidoreductase [Kribbella sp. NPDC051770]|uniref:LLM class flavin-dependent oxidoreductase n=1 Tax=Kribbella sp. NPDC051770 TaxID=3155413 RepID=UPI003439B290
MKFSVTFGAAGAGRDPRGLADLARLAEESGWDGVFLEDYLVYQGDASLPAYDPWVCLAAMACATSRVKLGTTVTPLPRRHPWKVAAEAVALDQLSDGRMILGAGIGDPQDPFMPSVSSRVLAEMLDESLQVIDALWSGEVVHHDGVHYQLDGVRLAARPVQRPRIPVWVGGNLLVPAVRRRILRWDGSCAYKGPTTASLPILPSDVAALRAERGDGFDIKVSGGDPEAFAAAGATWWGRWIGPGSAEEAERIVRAGPPRW